MIGSGLADTRGQHRTVRGKVDLVELVGCINCHGKPEGRQVDATNLMDTKARVTTRGLCLALKNLCQRQ